LNTRPAPPDDELEEYLRGGSDLSRQYRRDAMPLPPHSLDRRISRISRVVRGRSPLLAALALAASVLLSLAWVLAVIFGAPAARRVDDAPRLVRVAARADATPGMFGTSPQLYSSDPPGARPPARWLADIVALRRAGRDGEADAELLRFHRAYPGYPAGEADARR
jgi:hypothetical protein